MRNMEPSVIFQKNFKIRNLQNKKTLISNVIDGKMAVNFYPEGGQYLWDKPTRMGIKISNHSGVSIKGKLLDSKDKVISEFSTDIFGIGSFMVKNEKKNPLKIAILATEYVLPKPQDVGFSMEVNNLGEDSVRINILSSYKKGNEAIRVLMQSKGVVFEDIAMNLNQNALSLSIPKHDLPRGVYQITVFNESLLPQCERLIFVHTEESAGITVSVDKDKKVLNLTNGLASGEFSMSIADASQVNNTNNAESIEAYLLLSSELRGKVENPNYYFSEKTKEKMESLDNLMLTQGWRRYQWKEILENSLKTAKKYNQTEPLIVRGEVYSDDKTPILLTNVSVIILPMDSLQKPIFTDTDKNGKFVLENLDFTDSLKCVVKIMNLKGKEIKAKIKVEADAFIFSSKNETTLFKMSANSENTNLDNSEIATYKRNNLSETPKMLDEVILKASKSIDYDHDSNGNRLPKLYGEPDGVIQVSETTSGANVTQIIQGRIPAIKISGDGLGQPYKYSGRGRGTFTNATTTEANPNKTGEITDEPPLFLLDGIIVDTPREQGDFLMSIPPQDIERVDYLVNASASMYGARASNGVIAIYTKKGESNTKYKLTTNLLTLKLQGFQPFKEYYVSKDLEGIENKNEIKDILLWQPSFQLKEGESAFVGYDDNVSTSKIIVVIQGLFNNGEPISIVKTFLVSR